MVVSYSRHNANRLNYAKAVAVISIFLISTGSITVRTPAYGIVPNVNLTEWTIPTPKSEPLGLTLDPSGRCCWFVEYSGDKVGHFDPATNTFQEWVIPTGEADPTGIAATSISGSLTIWGTEFAKGKVFVFYPTADTFLEYSLPSANSGVEYVSVEPSLGLVKVWFTEIQRNTVGELIYDSHTGAATLYEDTLPAAVGGGANGVFAGRGYVWFAGFSGLARWERSTNQYTIWPLPTHGSAIGRFITFDSHGEPWYTQGVAAAEETDNYVGILRRDNTIREWQIPTPGSDPTLISLNPFIQNPWIAEQSSQAHNGQLAELDASAGGTVIPSVPTTALSDGVSLAIPPSVSVPAPVSSNTVTGVSTPLYGAPNGQFTEFPLDSSQPYDVIVDSSGNTWITESAANKIAKIAPISSKLGLSAFPGTISPGQGSSGNVTVTGTSITAYSEPGTLVVTSSHLRVLPLRFQCNPIIRIISNLCRNCKR